ncbi:MAG: hypothetical protein MZV64_31780 [Ignavibacteriales bacterium]|nr:hypothetical protein [Ignavibacteriales bacterium]
MVQTYHRTHLRKTAKRSAVWGLDPIDTGSPGSLMKYYGDKEDPAAMLTMNRGSP